MTYKPHIVESLDRSIFEMYGNRKQEGRIDFVLDISSKIVYAVPRTMEHSDFMPLLPEHGEKTVPFQYRYEQTTPPTITRIITGASSYEARTGIQHSARDLLTAHDHAFLFALQEARKGTIHVNNPTRELNRTYQKRS